MSSLPAGSHLGQSGLPGSPGSSPGTGTTAGGWSAVCTTCRPGLFVGAASTYDPADGEVVLFGGINASAGGPSGATWTYRSGTWTEVCTSCGPSPRAYAAMTFDGKDGYVVMFGGFDGGPLGDAWRFLGGSWSLLCSPCAPPARSGASLAYDAADGYVLLVGGCGATCPLGDAWSYSAGTWTQLCGGLCPFSPRDNASMAYDPVDTEIVLFGGWSGSRDLVNGWSYHAGSWTRICVPCAPAGRHGAPMAFDSTDGFLVLFGGYNSSTSSALNDTWEFFRGAFSPLALPLLPPPRSMAALADDPSDGGLLLFAGLGSAALGDTWEFAYGLVAPSPTATPATVDGGQASSLASTVAGGTAPYTYTWTGLPPPCVSTNVDPISCTPAAVGANTTFVVHLIVSDSKGAGVESLPSNFTVNTDPVIGSIVPSVPSAAVDAGQNLSLAVGISGGSGGYAFSWSGLPAGCSATGGRVMPCVPSGIGANTTFSIAVSATDSFGVATATATLPFVIDTDPVVTTPTKSASSVEVGSTVTFRSSASAGGGGYSWTWLGLPPGCTSVNSPVLSCVPQGVSLNTTFPVRAQVVDANGFRVTSAPAGVNVVAPPSVGQPNASPAVVDDGQTVALSVVAAGGVGNYTLKWLGLPPGCTSSDSPEILCTPTGVVANTTFQVQVNVTDGNGLWTIGPRLFLQVDALPHAGGVALAPATVDAGQSTNLSVRVSGGAGGYTFVWTGLPAGCASTNTPYLTCRPSTTLSANTSFSVGGKVTDAAGIVLTLVNTTLLVDATLQVSNVIANPSALDAGQVVSLSVGASLGGGSYAFRWWGLPTGCASIDSPSLTCVPNGGGANASLDVWTTVTDANGFSVASGSSRLEIDARPTIASAQASPNAVDLGQPVVLRARATYGSGSYDFHWRGLPGGCPVADSPILNCVPTSAGTWNVLVNATDTRGSSSPDASLNFTVVADPSIVAFYASAAPAQTGENVSFTVVTSGGIGPYTYSYSGLPSGCAGNNASRTICFPEQAGTFTVAVTVTDARGLGTSATLDWKVVGKPGPGTLFGLPAYLGLTIVGASVAAIVLVIFVLLPLLRRREDEEEPDGAAATSEAPGESDIGAAAEERETPVAPDGQEQGLPPDSLVPEGGALLGPGPGDTVPDGPQSPSPTLPEDTAGEGEALPQPFPAVGQATEAAPWEPNIDGASHEGTDTPPFPPIQDGEQPTPQVLTPIPSVAPKEAPPAARKRCPLCGTPLMENNVCRACELDWSKVQIQGRTDTLRARKSRTDDGPQP